MQDDPGDDDGLFEEAMNLIIRLQNDPDNAVSLEMVRRWRARSPAHEQTWAEIFEIHGMSGKVLADQQKAEDVKRLGPSRRNFMIAGALCAGAAATGALIVPGIITRAHADFATATAEIKRVPLPDGSFATLGPDSGIRLGFTAARREVQLLYGMVFVEVARDEERPFAVANDGLIATALGTAYDVSHDAGFVTVSVDHGIVQVDVSAGEKPRLVAGEWVRFTPGGRHFERGMRDLDQIAAWRNGMIVAEEEPISAVVARITRWQNAKVVIADQNLGALPISGVFDLRQPIRALEAVVHPYGGKVRQISPWLIVISKI